MRKLYMLVIAAAAALLCSCSGDMTLSTDSAQIIFDGFPMQSYTIDGIRVINVEGLCNYGFTITDNDSIINAVGDEYIKEVPDTSAVTHDIYEIGKAEKSKKKIQINSMTIDGYEADGNHYVSVDKLCAFRTDYNAEWGYSDYNFNCRNENDKLIIDVFRLRIIDQTGMWNRLNDMVSKAEVAVYTEDHTKSTVPYYIQRLENPVGIYAGVNADDVFESDYLSSSLNYIEFNDFQKDILLPNKDYIKSSSCMVVVAWNIDDLMSVFDNEEYIRETLDNLQKYHKPMIIRIGAEMNVSQLGDSPAAFVNAFRMMADIIHEYPDFAVMWSPNDMSALTKPFEYYWPGDEYVDWVGVSSFMKKHFLGDTTIPRDGDVYFMTGDFAYATNTLKNIVDFMERNNIKKPLAVSEGGVATQLNYQNGGEIYEWAKTRLADMYWYLPMKYPQIKIINYFNHKMEEEVQWFNLHQRPEFLQLINEALSNGQYCKTVNALPDFTFEKIENYRVEAYEIPLYTYAYLPEETIESVEYILDETQILNTGTKIPYKYIMKTEELPEGKHTLKVRINGSSANEEKNYIVIRSGKMIEIIEQ